MGIGAVLVRYAVSTVHSALSAEGTLILRDVSADSAVLRSQFEVNMNSFRRLTFEVLVSSL